MQWINENDELLLQKYAPVKIVATCGPVPSGTGISGLQIDCSCGDPEAYSFGNACAGTVRLQLDGAFPTLKGEPIGLEWTVNGTKLYPLFSGTVTMAEVNAGKTTISAGDVMAIKGGQPTMITDRMRDHMTAGEAWVVVASQLDVFYEQADVDQLDPIGIPDGFGGLPEEVSLSAMAGYVAGLIGCNAVIDRRGWLRLTGPTASAHEVATFSGYAGGSTVRDQSFTVTGISMERTDIVITRAEDGATTEDEKTTYFDAGDGSLLVVNPLAGQKAVDIAWRNLQGLSFQPGSYSFPQGIQLEPGDRIRVYTLEGRRSAVAMSISHTIDGGIRTTINCGGWHEDGGVPGQINQALKSLTAEFARIRKLVAENAEIVNARIDHLSAADIIAGRIRSEDFEVTERSMIYPNGFLYPSDTSYCSNGETIVKGFEIDFGSQTMRGSFKSEVTDELDRRLDELEQRVANLGG